MRPATLTPTTPAAARPVLDAPAIPALRRRLLGWYRRHRRDLPWRCSRDPYRVWISEIMLQQTRVDVVVPYFERFVTRFPDVAALARAPRDDVLQEWAGLGYYSRARHLHAAASVVLHQYGGDFAAAAPQLESLPGIGRYTAGAIRSIAFGQRAPILDGNVTRVFARLFALEGDVEAPAVRARLWALAAAWADCAAAGDANQALMELGALVCTKPVPACAQCPLAMTCVARCTERVHELPRPRRRAASVRLGLTAGLVHRDGRVLLVRRHSGRLLRDWWELPTCTSPGRERLRVARAGLASSAPSGAPPGADVRRLAAALRRRFGVGLLAARRLAVVQHGILNHRLEVAVLEAAARAAPARTSLPKGVKRTLAARERESRAASARRTDFANLDVASLEMRWVTAAMCRGLPLSTLSRKALRAAAAHDARWHDFAAALLHSVPLSAAPTPRPYARRSSRRGT